ncbi:senescence associated gene 20-like [Coffea arabica]|nr:senescence associated gene 20-like [Coffea arabica]
MATKKAAEANEEASFKEMERNSQKLVLALYDALKAKDVGTVQTFLAPDIEWWFHGPPSHQQHLMGLLTGKDSSFVFKPLSIEAFGSLVLVEGFDQKNSSVSWVHAWTVSQGRMITQVREYFNTHVTVTLLGSCTTKSSNESEQPQGASSQANPLKYCQSIWQSKLVDNSVVPGLVLAL